MALPPEFWVYLLAANLFAFAAFGYDKARARAGKPRVREHDLMLFALLGGAIGALIGRWVFRHKLRKRGFSIALFVVATAEAALLAGVAWTIGGL